MEEIVALPRRKPPFILWWTAAGFVSSCFFGIWLVESFLETGDEGLTTELVVIITAAMVAVWILIPLTCVVVANRHWRGLAYDSATGDFLFRRLRGSTVLRLPKSQVTGARADDDEFDARNAMDGGPSARSEMPGPHSGVTNRPLHHDLLVETAGQTHAVECHGRDQAERAAKRVAELIQRSN